LRCLRGSPRQLLVWLDMMDQWEQFRDEDAEPIDLEELKSLTLDSLPRGVVIRVMDSYFPDTTIWREGKALICEIEEHLYTKYWEHKFSAYAFAEAMQRAVLRLAHERHPFSGPTRDDDDDVHIFVRWRLRLPRSAKADFVVASVKSAFDLVWQRAESILENSDSVLILGKDTGRALARLKRIQSKLDELGYYTYIVKEQPDRAGEGIIQKVMRHALSSKFVLIENTKPAGHLYEIPHVTKAAECVTVVLQEEGKGATWMFEDAYAKHKHWAKITYKSHDLEKTVEQVAGLAEKLVARFAADRIAKLPWLKKTVK
jgi:hypothetical protein